MSNLPDDWRAYRRKCPECGHTYHLSGTEECMCVKTFQCERYYHFGEERKLVRCDTEVDDRYKLTNNFDGELWCEHCIDDYGFTCGICDEIFPHDELSARGSIKGSAWSFECCSDNLTVDGKRCCTWCDEEYREKKIGHHAATVVVAEESEETTSERIIRAQIEGGINAKRQD